MSEDWEQTRPYAEQTGDGRWLPQLRAHGQRVAWHGAVPLADKADAETYAASRRHGFIRAGRNARRLRKVEDVELPEKAPDGPQQAAWDHDWTAQVPGAEAKGGGYEATLHDRHPPFAVRWRCGHVHPDAGLAEVCALGARKALDRGERVTGPREHPGLDVTHPGGMRGAEPGAAVPPLRLPEPGAVHITADANMTVHVKAHARSRVTTRVNSGGALEVTISGPESD